MAEIFPQGETPESRTRSSLQQSPKDIKLECKDIKLKHPTYPISFAPDGDTGLYSSGMCPLITFPSLAEAKKFAEWYYAEWLKANLKTNYPSRRIIRDEKLSPITKQLNEMGYKTVVSCAGRKQGVEKAAGYISFLGHIAKAEIIKVCDGLGLKEIKVAYSSNPGATFTNIKFAALGGRHKNGV